MCTGSSRRMSCVLQSACIQWDSENMHSEWFGCCVISYGCGRASIRLTVQVSHLLSSRGYSVEGVFWDHSLRLFCYRYARFWLKIPSDYLLRMATPQSPGMVDPAIFKHLQAKIDEDTEAREVSRDYQVQNLIEYQLAKIWRFVDWTRRFGASFRPWIVNVWCHP